MNEAGFRIGHVPVIMSGLQGGLEGFRGRRMLFDGHHIGCLVANQFH